MKPVTQEQAAAQKAAEALALKIANAETVARRRRIAEIQDEIKMERDAA